MEFTTPIIHPKPRFTFSYEEPVMLLGSCFADRIGWIMIHAKLKVNKNPFGTLYNPASVAQGLRTIMKPKTYRKRNLFQYENQYHSFEFHSHYSSASSSESLMLMNRSLVRASEFFKTTKRLIVTWGSAYVYRLEENGKIVANCHKLPDKMFIRQRLSVEEIVKDWKALLLEIWKINPDLKVLFTVSPIRHWKDGAHGNQVSKATLLLAIEQLQEIFPEQTDYFPAYEIMMDELRDYRFYDDDMIHPTSLAIGHIWDQFKTNRLSKEALELLAFWREIQKDLEHKPFQPKSPAYKQFLLQTLLKIERINEKIPSFALEEEELLRMRIAKFDSE